MRKVLILAMVVCAGLAVLLTGCGGGNGCIDGKQPGLYLSASPASVEATGTDQITVTASGLDSNCKPIGAGVSVEMRLANQEPENPGDNPELVGQFSGGGTTANVPMTNLGARTTLSSTTAGTASVNASATIDGEYMSAIPVAVAFTSPPVDRCSISLEAEPGSIPADGASTSVITANLIAYDGGPVVDGTDVTFTTTHGEFTGSSDTVVTVPTSGGQALATLRSDDLDENQVAQVTATFICDDPLSTEKTNSRDVLFNAGGNQAFVTLNASANEILADGDSMVDLTAEVFLPDGTRAGAGEVVSFLTDRGSFSEAPVGSPKSFDAITDAQGRAYATFEGGIAGGTAHITASVYINNENVYAQVEINIRQVGFVEYISASQTKLGVRGSGKNETSLVTFAVKDTNDQPFPNVLVEFTHSQASGVTLEPLTARTDADGLVSTTLKSGSNATSVTVTATAMVGIVELSADSPALAIVGAKPNARFITFSCERFNVGGFIHNNVSTNCTILLADRYSNKIGFETAVTFMTEAGQIDSSVFTDDSPGPNMGSAVISTRTSDPRPADVDPWVDPPEPFIVDGAYTRNPRDGLVTIVAATTGEEEFTDLNGNGEYDQGEPFVDLPEPFIDKDDDGECGPGDYCPASGDNGQWDGPNGQWDGDTVIWTQTRMVWTGQFAYGPMCDQASQYGGLCGEVLMPPNDDPRWFNINKGASRVFYWRVGDFNLNPLNETLTVNARVDGKGSLGSTNPGLSFSAPDALGSGIEFVKVNNAQTMAPCTNADPICFVRPIVHSFSGGFAGWVVLEGAPVSNTQPEESGSLELTVNYQESPGSGATVNTGDTVNGTFQ